MKFLVLSSSIYFKGTLSKQVVSVSRLVCLMTVIFIVVYCKRYFVHNGDRDGTVVKVLCYKSEGRWFDPSWCHWNFSLT